MNLFSNSETLEMLLIVSVAHSLNQKKKMTYYLLHIRKVKGLPLNLPNSQGSSVLTLHHHSTLTKWGKHSVNAKHSTFLAALHCQVCIF